MGLRGCKPMPTALRLIRGNPGKRALPKYEPKPDQTPPECPEHIAADPAAKATWDYYLPMLVRMRVLTEADGLVLANLCLAHSFLLANLAKVRELNATPGSSGIAGMVLPAKTGYFVPNQLYQNVLTAMKQELSFCRELGLTPSSRSGIQTVGSGPAANPWDED